MSRKCIDVIIAHKNRPEISHCIQSLCSIESINQIIIGNGDSDPEHLKRVVSKFKRQLPIRIIDCSDTEFNKGMILNRCFQAVGSAYLLVSDADILWNRSTIQQLLLKSCSGISTVKRVVESDPKYQDSKINRIIFDVRYERLNSVVNISIVSNGTDSNREGCGLLLTKRKVFSMIGGYKENFHNWGWEDQDLLMRAKILGIKVMPVGSVVHMTHGDEKRNLTGQVRDKVKSRNANLVRALDEIGANMLFGPLTSQKHSGGRRVLINWIRTEANNYDFLV